MPPPRLAVVASHPVQYYAPLFRELAHRLPLTVYYGHKATPSDQARAGFGQHFDWDVDLLGGYGHQFLPNVAAHPRTDRFAGVDTPEVGAALRAGRHEVVVVMGWYLKMFLQALWAARRAGLPVLVRGDSQLATPRSPIKRAAKELLYPPFLRQFSAALVVGARNRAYWQHYRYPQERMFASPHCVDTHRFAANATNEAREAIRQRFGIAATVPVALFAGKLLDFKRPLDVIEGAARARGQGVSIEVMVAGDGPLRGAMQQQAATHGVPLHFLGFCNQTQMPAAYAAADMLVLPSTGRETWGLVANEALACGRPVVLSDAVGCAADLAGDGTTGRIFPMGDVQALGRAMAVVAASPPAACAILARSQAFSIEAAADGVVRAVHAVVHRRGAA